MMTETARNTAASEIRRVIETWRVAILERDIGRIVGHYAPDVVAFDAIKALQFRGLEDYRRHWEECMQMCAGGMIFEIHDLDVEADDELAFAHALTRCGVAADDGHEDSNWMRMTTCCRRIDGQWRIVHEHFSAPFDVETLKVLSLTP